MWVELRADAQRSRDQTDAHGQDTAEDDEAIGDLDGQITRSGMRGNVLPTRPVRHHRSTRRRQDTPDLPQGVIAGSRDANRCIGYLTKYLTKHVADCHQARTPAQHEHAERLADALRYEPCSPTCSPSM
jgi:hypothetical protein